jgi:cytochrome c oxidase cbb3-type subunit 2
MFRRAELLSLPISLVVFLAVFLAAAPSGAAAQSAKADTEQIKIALAALEQGALLKSGRELYRMACSGCHGVKGDGRGPGAQGFAQRPTDFTLGLYKFRSTPFNALPTDEDLERSIRIGMPGTEMVPYGNLLDRDSRMAIALYLKTFSEKFADPAAQPKPGAVAKIPADRPFPLSEATAEAGRQVWEDNDCGDCHGESGEGTTDEEDGQGFPVFMVPFSAGYFKGGNADSDLYRSIVTGMNNTTMESYAEDIQEEQRWQLVDYIRSLEKKGGFWSSLFSDSPSGFGYGKF